MRHLRLICAYSCYAVGTPWYRVCLDFVSSLSRFLYEFCLIIHLKVKQNSPQKRDKLNIALVRSRWYCWWYLTLMGQIGLMKLFLKTSKNSNCTNKNIRDFRAFRCWRKNFRCIRLGETAGVRGRFCRGSREFLPGKLELRGRCQIWQRPLPSLVAGAAKSVIGRGHPFLLFDYLQSGDSDSFAKVRKSERITKRNLLLFLHLEHKLICNVSVAIQV